VTNGKCQMIVKLQTSRLISRQQLTTPI